MQKHLHFAFLSAAEKQFRDRAKLLQDCRKVAPSFSSFIVTTRCTSETVL